MGTSCSQNLLLSTYSTYVYINTGVFFCLDFLDHEQERVKLTLNNRSRLFCYNVCETCIVLSLWALEKQVA